MQTHDPPSLGTPYEALGGELGVQALVDRFYDLMDLEPAYAELRATHGNTLDNARQRLFWFLCGWLGGPGHYVERFGHPRLRMRHLPFAIGIRERDQWLACMHQAMSEAAVPQRHARAPQRVLLPGHWMRNRLSERRSPWMWANSNLARPQFSKGVALGSLLPTGSPDQG